MSDRFFGTTFGPSTIGAINLISGNTHGVSPVGAGSGASETMVLNSLPLLRRLRGRGDGAPSPARTSAT